MQGVIDRGRGAEADGSSGLSLFSPRALPITELVVFLCSHILLIGTIKRGGKPERPTRVSGVKEVLFAAISDLHLNQLRAYATQANSGRLRR